MTATAPQPRGSLPLGVLMGAVVAAIVLSVIWFGAGLGTMLSAQPSASVGPAASTPPASVTPSASATPTPTPSASATPTPTPSVSAEPVAGLVTELRSGTWVTVLQSMRKTEATGAQAVARAAELSTAGHTAVAIDADAFPNSFSPGYYAIGIPGAADSAAAAAVCDALGITDRAKCFPREIKG
ncbi:MAG: hypothetical protein QM708_01540 [Propioniciclava sp.]|uniref:hypothetical protein n=1 Tax=Propioniciclava sp. TaxID=2038686 RepID=UPI0039E61E37